jgi:hypothetical protein
LHFDYVVQPKLVPASSAASSASASKSKRSIKSSQQELIPIHPIMSTVTFITAECGGPTLVYGSFVE